MIRSGRQRRGLPPRSPQSLRPPAAVAGRGGREERDERDEREPQREEQPPEPELVLSPRSPLVPRRTVTFALFVVAALGVVALVRALRAADDGIKTAAAATEVAPAPKLATRDGLGLGDAVEPAPPTDPRSSIALDPAAARAERWEARAALEIGDSKRAARVATLAVAHDPSEAEGWLLLTAAEIDNRNPVASRLALRACAKKATRGPRGECIALLRPEERELLVP